MNNPYDYFEYKGKKYGLWTIIRSKSSFEHVGYNYMKYWGNGEDGKYIFVNVKSNIGPAIKPKEFQQWDNIEIVEPHEIGEFASKYKYGKATSYIDYSVGWFWYIIAMVVSLLFKECILGWITATIIFLVWRKNQRGE